MAGTDEEFELESPTAQAELLGSPETPDGSQHAGAASGSPCIDADTVIDTLDDATDSTRGACGSGQEDLIAQEMQALLSSQPCGSEDDEDVEEQEEEEEESGSHVRRRRGVSDHTRFPPSTFRNLDEAGLDGFNFGGYSHKGFSMDFGGNQNDSRFEDDIGAMAGLGIGGFGSIRSRKEPSMNDIVSSFMSSIEEALSECSPAEKRSRWCRSAIVIVLLLGLWFAAVSFRPLEHSLKELVHETYELPRPVDARKPLWPVQLDKSMEGAVDSVKYINHNGFAIGKVTIKVQSQPSSGNKKTTAVGKFYEHRYVGILNTWVPVPYLPQPGSKKGTYGLGACVVGRCVCMPDFSDAADAKKKATKSDRSSGCFMFQGGGSAALNVMAAPTVVLFILWQFSGYWSMLEAHATLSMKNLAEGRIWVLLVAPISHRSWPQMLHLWVGLANTLDSFDKGDLPFWVFILLYWGGAWAAWLGKIVIWRWLLKADRRAYHMSEMGGAVALTAQMAFLNDTRPGVRYSYSLYFMPIPVELSAWQAALLSMVMDVMRDGFYTWSSNWSKLFGHATSFAWGYLLGTFWLRTQEDI